MSKRKTIEVKGDAMPIMTSRIENKFHPERPPKIPFPAKPEGLTGEAAKRWLGDMSGEVERTSAAAWDHWLSIREPDAQIRIEFMSWAWVGRLLGEGKVNSLDEARLNDAFELILKDGRIVHGHTEDLPNDRICANAAILREERESGISYAIERVGETVQTIDANTKPHKQRKNAESGFDAAMKKRDHKRRKTPGAEAQYPKEKIQEAVAEIKRRVKDSKGKLTLTQAAKDVHAEMMLFKVDSDYLRRECYERKGAKPAAKGKTAHR